MALIIVTRDNLLAAIGGDAQVTVGLLFTTTDTENVGIWLNKVDKVLVSIAGNILDIHVVILSSTIIGTKFICSSVNSASYLSVIRRIQKVSSLDKTLREDLSAKSSVSTEGDAIILSISNIVSGMRWHEGAEGSV